MKTLLALAITTIAAIAPVAQAKTLRQPQIDVELISELREIAPGQSFRTALVLRPDDQWHVYWKNPGDSGLAPKVEWAKPDGFQAGDLLFTAPHRIPYHSLVNFGYEGETLFITDWKAPNTLKPGTEVELRAKAKWLVCKEECIPGKAELTLLLKVVTPGTKPASDSEAAAKIVKASMTVPRPDARDSGIEVRAQTLQEKESGKTWLRLTLKDLSGRPIESQIAYFFEGDEHEASAKQHLRRNVDGTADLLLERRKTAIKPAKGILVARTSAGELSRTFEIQLPLSAPKMVLPKAELLKDAPAQEFTSASHAPMTDLTGLPLMLVFAVLGGLILNLMPCIFPVLSIKILGFAEQGGKDPREIALHGWIFTLGIMVSFWVLAFALFGLQSAGMRVGWGFQLQSPPFVALLALMFFLISLNLLGFFEIGGRAVGAVMGAGSSLTRKQGLSGTFFTGVLTTVAATPCSAPFMTTALGFALTQPAWVGTLILTFVGLGLALPYLLLSLFPQWTSKLPRPGRWMETFRQALSFPLLLTTLWLLWVLSMQAGSLGVLKTLGAFLTVTFLIWLKRYRWFAAVLFVGLWVQQGWWKIETIEPGATSASGVETGVPTTAGTGATQAAKTEWKKFNAATVQAARDQGLPVFIDFTADWCVTCKVNEKLVLDSDYVQQAFIANGVQLFKADWTNADPEITDALSKVGRNSVPLYLWYAPGANQPEILPQLLSAGGIVSRIQKK